MKRAEPPSGAARARKVVVTQERPQSYPGSGPQSIAASPAEWRERRRATWRAAQIAADPLFQNLVRRLVAQGERSVGELLAEIASRHGIERELCATLDRYTSIPSEALDAAGGRRFPPAPLSLVRAP